MLSDLIKNDYFQLVGWVMTVIGGAVAIRQTLEGRKLKRENAHLNDQLKILNQQISVATNLTSTRDRNVAQGDGSQYIESATGPINIRTGRK